MRWRRGHEAPDPRLATIKMVVAVVGIATFGAGLRWESTPTRWIGIGVVAVAWFLRFVAGRTPEPNADESADKPRPPGD